MQQHAPTPDRVRDGKLRRESGELLPPGRTERLWFCRSCGKEDSGRLVPAGWYSLTRHAGTETERPLRLGLYCSLPCLEVQLPRIRGIGHSIGNAWLDKLPAHNPE
jgi:hypothetical protein